MSFFVRRSVDALMLFVAKNDPTHIIPSVWKETQESVDLAKRVAEEMPTEFSSKYLGQIAGSSFARREVWYDSPITGRGTN